MLKLIAYKLAQSLVSLLIVTALTFTLLAAAGGDALSALGNDPLISERTLERMRKTYELDRPLAARYVGWLTNALGGDLGESFYYRSPVLDLIVSRAINTALLALLALVIAWSVALTLGTMAAARAGSWIDRLSDAVILITASTPRLVVALVSLAFLARYSLLSTVSQPSAARSASQFLVAAFAISFPLIALFLAQVRAGVGAALKEDFVTLARAKGLRERDILLRHALRAALSPLITILGYSLGGVMSGSIIVEAVLGLQGLGSLSVNAVRSRDVPLLLGVVIITSLAVFVGNLIADALRYLNDPRMRDSSQPEEAVIRAT